MKSINSNKNYKALFFIIITFIIFGLFNIPFELFFITVWIELTLIYKFKSKLSIVLSIILIILWIFISPFGLDDFQSKLNVVIYSLLFYSALQLLFEERKISKGEKFNYKNIYEDETQLFRSKLYSFIGLQTMFKNKNVLDLGCGYGPDAINFSEYAKSITALDIEKHKEWEKIKNNKIKFVVGKSEKIPFKNNTFDVIFLKDLLHHVGDVDKSLNEIYRVAKKNGKIIIVEGNRYNPIFYIWATKLNGHEHFTLGNFNMMLGEHFKFYTIYNYNIYPPFLMKKKMYLIFARIVDFSNKFTIFKSFFSYNISVITKK